MPSAASALSSQSLPADEMAARFLDNLEAIEGACVEAGPFIYAVHTTRIRPDHRLENRAVADR